MSETKKAYKYQIDNRESLQKQITFEEHIILILGQLKIFYVDLAEKHILTAKDKLTSKPITILDFKDFLEFIIRNNRVCVINCTCRECNQKKVFDFSQVNSFLHYYNQNIKRRECNCTHYIKMCPSKSAVTYCCKLMMEKLKLEPYSFSGEKPVSMYTRPNTFAVKDDEYYYGPAEIPCIHGTSITMCDRFEWKEELAELNSTNNMGLVKIIKNLFDIDLRYLKLEEKHTMNFIF